MPTTQKSRIWIYSAGAFTSRRDLLGVEEPLEIRLRGVGGATLTFGTTLRTPGNDFELAAGLLFGEGIVAAREEIAQIRYCVDEAGGEQQFNVLTVDLRGPLPDLEDQRRRFNAGSACGVCGRAGIDDLLARCEALAPGPLIAPAIVLGLPAALREEQRVFAGTGGIHAAGLFDTEGKLVEMREDIGRHNAVDKLVGWALLNRRLPLREHILLISGRPGFEIVQKAAMARIPMLCGISAPSSLAVTTAKRLGMTLVGFLRDERFNLYSAPERLYLT